MRKLILKMSMSLDGFVAGPNGEGDWILRSRDEGGAQWVAETLSNAGLLVMGSRTYFGWAEYWPNDTSIFAAPMNEIPKMVFTRQKSLDLTAGKAPAQNISPAAASWAAAKVASGDLTEQMHKLKAQDGKDILASGGAGFARSLVGLGLVDEFRLVIHPVVLGSGAALFSELQRQQDLKLISTSLFRSGGAAHVYRLA